MIQNVSESRGTTAHGCAGASSQPLSADETFASTDLTSTPSNTANNDFLLQASSKIGELTILIQSLNATLSDVGTEFAKDSVNLGPPNKQQFEQTVDRISETMKVASNALTDLTDKLDRYLRMNCSQSNNAGFENLEYSLSKLDSIQHVVLSQEDLFKTQTETFKTMLNETMDISKNQTKKKFDGFSQKMNQMSTTIDLIMNKFEQLDAETVGRKNDLTEIKNTLQTLISDAQNLTTSNRIHYEGLMQTNKRALASLKMDVQGNLDTVLDRLDVLQNTTYDKLNDIDRVLNETNRAIEEKRRLEKLIENEKSQIWRNLTNHFDRFEISLALQEQLLSSVFGSIGTLSTNISDQIGENCKGNELFGMLENVSVATTVGQHTLKNEIVHVFSQNQQQVIDSQERFQIQISNLTQEVLSQNNQAICSAIIDKLEEIERSSCTNFSNITDALNSLATPRPTVQSDAHAGLVGEVEIIKNLTQSISSSIAVTSDKVRGTTLSSAIVALLDDTQVIYEAVVNSSSSAVCRSDGCFIKTIPVGLSPSSTVVQKDSVRLANAQISSSSIRGRLEVYRSGSWGTVCDDSFSNTDARVVCRMFGYSYGAQKQSAYFGAGTGNIHMDDVGCSGRETSIFSCSYTSSHNCGHSEDVGIICT